MSFNKNSIKRIANELGIPRVQTVLVAQVQEWEREYLHAILKRATIILHFAERKTIQVSDLNLLAKFYGDLPHIFTITPVLKTTRKGFRELVRDLLEEIDPEIRCSAETVLVLQYLLENKFSQKLKNNKKFCKINKNE